MSVVSVIISPLSWAALAAAGKDGAEGSHPLLGAPLRSGRQLLRAFQAYPRTAAAEVRGMGEAAPTGPGLTYTHWFKKKIHKDCSGSTFSINH